MSTSIVVRGPQKEQQQRMILLFLFIAVAQLYNSLRECTYLLKCAVLLPHLAPWHHLMDHADASSFLHMTGLTRDAFILLLNILQPPSHPARGTMRGRRCSLPPDSQLGLLLFYLGSTMGIKHSLIC